MKEKVCSGRGKFLGKGCGLDKLLFSHGLCRDCAGKAYSEAKSAKNTSERTADTTDKKKYAKSSVWRRKTTGEAELFRQIWEQRPHVSEISGKKLLDRGHHFWYSQFAHVVSKGARPELRLNADNIIMMTFDEHFTWDNHRHKLKDKEEWKWVFEKYEQIRNKQP